MTASVNLTLGKGGKKDDKDVVVIHGLEAEAKQLRWLDASVEEFAAEQKVLRSKVVETVRARFNADLAKGQLHTNFAVESDDGRPIPVIMRESYKAIPLAPNRDVLLHALGEDVYFELWAEDTIVSVKKTATLEALKHAAGDRWPAVADLLDIREVTKPSPGYFAARAKLATRLAPELLATLDAIDAQVVSEPQVKPKG